MRREATFTEHDVATDRIRLRANRVRRSRGIVIDVDANLTEIDAQVGRKRAARLGIERLSWRL